MDASKPDPLLEFWNQRASLGVTAGTNDFMITEIEQRFIADLVPPGSRVLDIGCGNANSLIKLASERDCTGVGIDFADKMVEQSKKFITERRLDERLSVFHRSVPPVPTDFGTFDVVISNRALINLRTADEQRRAIQSVPAVLRLGGSYLMIECSMEGGERTNALRRHLGMAPIDPPWHNLFFREADVESWQTAEFTVEKLLHISSLYHLLSRVVYAKLAEMKGEELKYDSDINKIALLLPQQIGDFGPVKAWVWRKRP